MATTAKYISMTQIRHLSYKKVRSWYSGLVKAKPREAPFDHVVQIGDPVLRATSAEIPRELIKSEEMKFLIAQMRKVMTKYKCVGLAATQVGVPFRLFLLEVTERHLKEYKVKEREIKEMSLVPFKVVINPIVKVTDYTKLTFPENCESVKGFHAEVTRFRGVKLTGYDHEDVPLEMDLHGWPARIVQHEMDHLDGKLYTDIMDRKSFTCSCWEVINTRGGKVELPYGAD